MPTKRAFAVALLISIFALQGTCFAEASTSERSVTGFFRRLFGYPAKAAQETAGITTRTADNLGNKVVSQTGSNTAAIAGGDLSKAGSLVVDPVVGTLETTGQTVSETVQMPVKAAEE